MFIFNLYFPSTLIIFILKRYLSSIKKQAGFLHWETRPAFFFPNQAVIHNLLHYLPIIENCSEVTSKVFPPRPCAVSDSDRVEKEVTISGSSDIAADILTAVDDTFDFSNKLTVLSLKSAYNTLTDTEKAAVKTAVGTTAWNKFISRVNQKMYSLKNEPSSGYYSYTKGTSSNVVIEINANFGQTYVTEIRMGKNLTVIDPQHYEVKEGSVVVTLSSSYLKTIKTAGKYNLYIDLMDLQTGRTETLQTVVRVVPATDIPQTGDPFRMNLWVGLLGASVLALAGLGVYEVVKKKKNAQKRLEAAMNLDEEPSDEANTNE